MPTHDCTTCKSSGSCPLESIAPWLNGHEEEAERIVKDSADEIADVCVFLSSKLPALLLNKNVLVAGVEVAFLLGYHKGITHQDIPQAFRDM